MMRETSQDYVPEGYVFNEPMENARAQIISIFEKERRVEKDGVMVKLPNEYETLIRELWDYCDTQPINVIEGVVVEFEGKIIGLSEDLELLWDEMPSAEWEYFNSYRQKPEKWTDDMKTYDSIFKERSKIRSYRTQLEDYLKVRMEQDATI